MIGARQLDCFDEEATAFRVSTWSMVINGGKGLLDGNVGAKPDPVCQCLSPRLWGELRREILRQCQTDGSPIASAVSGVDSETVRTSALSLARVASSFVSAIPVRWLDERMRICRPAWH